MRPVNQMKEEFDNDVEECLKVLKAGGLILYPTDTIWGIGCDPTNEKAVERIFALKQRSDKKAMIVLMADERDVLQYVANPDLRVFDYLNQSNRPTTVIYEGAIGLANNLTADDGSVAIRICYDIFCRHLIKRFRKPLVSTSANISGLPPSKTFADIPNEIKKGVDHIVQYRQADTSQAEASSIIKWNKDGTVTVIRK
ncbi:MAG: L-threonylcarbamoyladenylate synthase [Chitinophagaceae bacterium]